MGILNVTPDSFSDGGRFMDADDALRRAEEMIEEGAAIIDVGGESSRPAGSVYGEGAAEVSADEERRRVEPIVQGITSRFPDVIVSVDTCKPQIADAVLHAGAHIINDVTGLRYHSGTAAAVAAFGAALIVMHSTGRPGAMPPPAGFDDVIEAVSISLRESVEKAEGAGVRHIIIDPGFGFGKTHEENLELIRRMDTFTDFDRPVLIGVSRKSSIGAVLGGAPVGGRLYGSLGAAAAALLRGASIVRTHDVRATLEMIRVIDALKA